MKDREPERKVRPRSATITASGMSARFLKRNKGKDEEVDNVSGDSQNSSSAKETTVDEKEKDKKDKGGSKLKKSERRPHLSLSLSPPLSVPSSLSTPTTSDFLECARTPTAEQPRPSLVRHARSGSNLSASAREQRNNLDDSTSNLAEGVDIVTSSGKKKKSGMGIVKGVSVRAERLMRGFDSALDFVDGR